MNLRPAASEWTCTIRATQAGDDRYAPAVAVERSFKYVKNPMVLQVQSGSTLSGTTSQAITTAVRLADSTLMTGISSLGHLLTVQSLTFTVCRVDSNALVSLSGGTFNRTMVTVLASGTCSLKFDFVGTDDRAPATLTWNAAASLTR